MEKGEDLMGKDLIEALAEFNEDTVMKEVNEKLDNVEYIQI